MDVDGEAAVAAPAVVEAPAAAAAADEMDLEEVPAADGGKEPAVLVQELTAFEDAELPENKTGWYELVAILTHKGPNADVSTHAPPHRNLTPREASERLLVDRADTTSRGCSTRRTSGSASTMTR